MTVDTDNVFLTDTEKMEDFVRLSKKEFLDSYSYLTEEEYNNTSKLCKKMSDDLFNYIYDAMCWALEYMDEVYSDDKGRKQYEKLDRAVGKFYNWYNN
jgi:hypothetical protein